MSNDTHSSQFDARPVHTSDMTSWEGEATAAIPHITLGQVNWPMIVRSLIARVRASESTNTVLPYYTMKEGQDRVESPGFQMDMAQAEARLTALADLSHAVSASRGWWTDKATGEPKSLNIGERYALMHSELSEGFEGVRTDAWSTKIPTFTNEEEELADLLHRVFDYARAKRLRLGAAFAAKAFYNLERKDHSLEARSAAGGKKF